MEGAALMIIETELMEGYSVQEIKQGFCEDSNSYTCVVCGEQFKKDEIYNYEGKFFNGGKAVRLHIEKEHHSIKEILLNVSASDMGVSQLQLKLLNFFSKGLNDREIANQLGVASSTIRNHRHKLRERERQNKVFVSLMELLKEEGFVYRGSSYVQKLGEEWDSTNIPENVRKRVLDRYMTETGILKEYPIHERSKRIILEAILVNFSFGVTYSENEIDAVLKTVYEDYKLLRDELLKYRYLDRTNIGAVYWVKNPNETQYLGEIAK